MGLATPGTKAFDAVGGAFRPQWRRVARRQARTEIALRIPLGLPDQFPESFGSLHWREFGFES